MTTGTLKWSQTWRTVERYSKVAAVVIGSEIQKKAYCNTQCLLYLFFFQAEDGIRDLTVTGVQTCALPISREGTASVPEAPARSAIARAWDAASSRFWSEISSVWA